MRTSSWQGMDEARWVPHWDRVKLHNSCLLSCLIRPPFGRYHELQDTGNWVGGGAVGMETVSVYIWQPIFSKYGCTYSQSMAAHISKVWLYIFPKYGCTYFQSMAAHILKVWLHIFPKYGCTYFQSMAAHISKVWLHIFPKEESWGEGFTWICLCLHLNSSH